ncbi:MAG: hypothetical protein ACREQC_18660, partial [Candidatus Binataceae bacterium]
IQLGAHRREQRRFLHREFLRRGLRERSCERAKENGQTKGAQNGTKVTTDGDFQGLPHLLLDGTAKHPVYATAGNGTKLRIKRCV